MSRKKSTIRLPTQWIFFDVGYTLLDETPAWDEQFVRLAAELAGCGTTVSTWDLWQQLCLAARNFSPGQWRAVCAAFAKDDARTRELMMLSSGWRHDLQFPHPRVRATLSALASRYQLGVIANQSAGTRDRLEQHGLLPFISVVVGSAEAKVHKPDPAIFHLALREANCDPVNAWMIGDRIDNDVRPANLLAMRTVHVRQGPSGAQRPREAAEEPTHAVDSIAEVLPLFIGD